MMLMKRTIKRWGLAFLFVPLLLGTIGIPSAWAAFANYTMSDFSFLPPFLGTDIKPNILLIIDTSGSMNECAYPDSVTVDCENSSSPSVAYQAYDPDDPNDPNDTVAVYYGYFEPDKCYTYGSSKFTPVSGSLGPKVVLPPPASSLPVCQLSTGPSTGTADKWDGNFLNWVTMRRIDITKWALTGGQCNSIRSSDGSCSTFTADNTTDDPIRKRFAVSAAKRLVPSTYTTTGSQTRCFFAKGGRFKVYSAGNPGSCPSSSANATGSDSFQTRIDAGVKSQGVIQAINPVGGVERARLGLMIFNTGSNPQGGKVLVDIGGNIVTLVQQIESISASSKTPLAETLYEASRYFAQIQPAFLQNDYQVHVNNDPYCFGDLVPPANVDGCRNNTQGQWVSCCRSFALVFTDGQPTQDTTIPGSIQDAAHAIHSNHSNHHDCHGSCGSGSHYLDDVAYWAHTTDLRPQGSNIAGINATPNTNGLNGMQNLTVYTFFAFGAGATILQDAAKAGGFEDSNGNNLPDLVSEWDRKTWTNGVALDASDGIPDTYFEASSGDAIQTNLLAALNDILQKSASGTAVSFLATSSSGEGAIYQSYFFPTSNESSGQISWVGHLHGLFLDNEGQLREDTNQDGRLVLQHDKVVSTFFDQNANATKVKRCDVNSEGEVTTSCTDLEGLDEIDPIWEAGELLALRDASDRKMTTWVDSDGDGVVDTGEVIPFNTTNKTTLKPYLRAVDDTESGKIIDFIRGEAVGGYRNRMKSLASGEEVWKLGDILYSDPVVVNEPKENYSKQFGDATYAPFLKKYANRRGVVYVGGNDGMLHAFNAGFFHPGDNGHTPEIEHGYITTNETDNSGGTPLGEELWAFVPQELLPHLRWLTQTDYDKDDHVSFVDGSPRIAEAQIFDADDTHPNGWGTILIVGMRGGGGLMKADINQDGDTDDIGEDRFRSAYLAFDITDPEAADYPKLLWVFKDPDLGFSQGFPSVVRLNATTWYAVFGSGPTTYKGERITSTGNKFESGVSTNGFIYVVDLKTGKLGLNGNGNGKFQAGTDSNAFMGDPVGIDAKRDRNAATGEKDYIFDAIYIGQTFRSNSDGNNDGIRDWHGKLYRFLTNDSSNPVGWTLSVLFDPQKPVLTQPTVVRDRSRAPWVVFGTGRFFSSGTDSDQNDTMAQAIYAIKEGSTNGCWDTTNNKWKTNCSNTVSMGSLFDATDLGSSITAGGTCINSCGVSGVDTIFELAENNAFNNKAGWVLNLSPGERVLRRVTYLSGVLAVPSYTPTIADVCNAQGTSTLYALYYQTGTAFGSKNNSTGPLSLESNSTTIARSTSLGIGIAARVALVATKDTVTGYIQTSTGTIQQVKMNLTVPKQGIKIFREETER